MGPDAVVAAKQRTKRFQQAPEVTGRIQPRLILQRSLTPNGQTSDRTHRCHDRTRRCHDRTHPWQRPDAPIAQYRARNDMTGRAPCDDRTRQCQRPVRVQ
jgi:hypothetical protein